MDIDLEKKSLSFLLYANTWQIAAVLKWKLHECITPQ